MVVVVAVLVLMLVVVVVVLIVIVEVEVVVVVAVVVLGGSSSRRRRRRRPRTSRGSGSGSSSGCSSSLEGAASNANSNRGGLTGAVRPDANSPKPVAVAVLQYLALCIHFCGRKESCSGGLLFRSIALMRARQASTALVWFAVLHISAQHNQETQSC